MPEQSCPACAGKTRQVKAGMNGGRQQYRCGHCGRRYVPDEYHRYPSPLRERAATLREKGYTLAQIASLLGVTPRTLGNWFRNAKAALPENREEPADTARTLSREPLSGDAPVRRRVTIQDVAERAGVTASTVSNHLNNKGRVAASTRARIGEAIESLHFTPNALTRAIRERRTGIIGAVGIGFWDIDNAAGFSIMPPILTGIQSQAEILRHEVLLYTSFLVAERYGSGRFLDGHIDGLIWGLLRQGEHVLERTAAAGLPILAILTRHVPSNVGYVTADNVGAMHMIVEHLTSLGRTRIGYYGSLHDSNHIDRYQGFRDAMEAAGLTWDPSAMKSAIRQGEEWERERLESGLNILLEKAAMFDAIIAPNDYFAAWTVEKLRERGFRVPEDIAVVGFDDVPDAAHAAGGITTIRQPFWEIARTAVDRLVAMIDGAPVSECRITLPTELVVRASTIGQRG